MKPELSAGAEPGVLVIHCSDSRFQRHFQEFLRAELGVEHYTLLAVPGGVQLLTLVDYLPKFSWAGWRWVKFVADVNPPARVILIAHEDCRWYLSQRFGTAPQGVREKQVRDLRAARAGLEERLGKVPVELYYARLADGRAIFERL